MYCIVENRDSIRHWQFYDDLLANAEVLSLKFMESSDIHLLLLGHLLNFPLQIHSLNS